MRSVDEHLAAILAAIRPIAPIELGLLEAEGGVLTEDIAATHPLPSFDNSAMDGYAVHAADISGAAPGNPVTPARRGRGRGRRHRRLRGDTGRGHPDNDRCAASRGRRHGGAGRVDRRRGDQGRGAPGRRARARDPAHRRRSAGGRPGPRRGTRVGPVQLGLLAAAGRSAVPVRPRPRVAVLSTGNELAEPGTPVTPGRIWESNSFMLAAAARQAGGIAYRHGAVPDDSRALMAAIEDQLMRADVLVTSGGVSMGGEHDVVKDTLSRLGSVEFTQGRDAAGDAAGLRRGRRRPDTDLHPAG